MQNYAKLVNGQVAHVLNLPGGETPAAFFPGDNSWVACPSGVQPGWARHQDGSFTAPVVPAPSPAEQMAAAVFAGCAVTSTGTPALNATYDAFGARWQQMRDEVLYIASFGVFSAGLSELDWQANSGEVVFSTTDQFKAVARAIGDWLTGWQRFADGKTQSPPAAPVIA